MKPIAESLEGVVDTTPQTQIARNIMLYFNDELESARKQTSFHAAMLSYGTAMDNAKRVIARQPKSANLTAIADYHLASVCDKHATVSDAITAGGDWQSNAFLTGKFAEQLEDSDEVIVDAGCGTGLELNALAREFPTKRFIGYDLSARCLDVAIARAKRTGNDNVSFYRGNHNALPSQIPQESADVLYCKFFLSREDLFPLHLQPRGLTGQEAIDFLRMRYSGMRGVLKPGGSFVLISCTTEQVPLQNLPDLEPTGATILAGRFHRYYVAGYRKPLEGTCST